MVKLLAFGFAGWLLTVLAERWAQPLRRSAWRGPYALMIHAGLFFFLYFAIVALTQRPMFSSGMALALVSTIILVNNAKYQALQEAFVFTDFSLFSQAAKHPRLYLPFLSPIAAGLGLVAISGVIYLGVSLDQPLSTHMSLIALITVVLFGGLCGILLLIAGTRGVAEPSFDVHKDIEAFGLVASLWIHRQSEARFKPVQAVPGIPRVSMPQEEREESTHLGHIVVVQSESFFDARRLLPAIRPELLQAYDRVRAQALCAGRLQVPAWGANTMRTEFAFLTGIEDSQLGVHGFNPYRKLARQSMDSIASRLSEIGYDSLCLHPHPATFFGRDQVFPALGFKRFLDIKDFPDAEPFGPCIGDAAVTEKIIDILAGATQPTLLFAITMENHGPLHLEKVSQDELSGLYTHPPEAGFEDLSVYLRHLRNADAMIDRLTLHLRRYHPSSTLVFYGDHVPSMPKVYDRLRFTDGRSDYFVWSAGQASREMTEQDLKVEQLATQTLLACGLVDS